VLEADGGLRRLGRSGIPVGCLSSATYENLEAQLGPEEILYVFSDGAFELRRGDWSLEDLEARLARHGAAPGALDAILAELRGATGEAGFSDDVTMLRVRRSRNA
jgi:sigma-B regulation protein RsbU (phosphoserine phosphatase)